MPCQARGPCKTQSCRHADCFMACAQVRQLRASKQAQAAAQQQQAQALSAPAGSMSQASMLPGSAAAMQTMAGAAAAAGAPGDASALFAAMLERLPQQQGGGAGRMPGARLLPLPLPQPPPCAQWPGLWVCSEARAARRAAWGGWDVLIARLCWSMQHWHCELRRPGSRVLRWASLQVQLRALTARLLTAMCLCASRHGRAVEHEQPLCGRAPEFGGLHAARRHRRAHPAEPGGAAGEQSQNPLGGPHAASSAPATKPSESSWKVPAMCLVEDSAAATRSMMD